MTDEALFWLLWSLYPAFLMLGVFALAVGIVAAAVGSLE